MKAAIITPIPDLQRFATVTQTQMALAPLFDIEDKRYTEFYRSRSQRGDYVILDNGAYKTDGGSACSMSWLMEASWAINASEVVVPDVIHDHEATIQKGIEAMTWLRSSSGRLAYELAGRPRPMIVPQGDELLEWKHCLDVLLPTAYETTTMLEGPDPCIGVSKVYGKGILERLRELDHYPNVTEGYTPVHLLGWAADEQTLLRARDHYKWIRSIDTARPITYGRYGYSTNESKNGEHLTRDVEFFEDAVPADQRAQVLWNIDTFCKMVGQDVDERALSL